MWGAHFNNWGSGLCGFGPSFGNGPWFLGWIFPLLFWGLIALLLVSILKNVFSGSRMSRSDEALELLRNRFASGEIDEQEYSARKAALRRG